MIAFVPVIDFARPNGLTYFIEKRQTVPLLFRRTAEAGEAMDIGLIGRCSAGIEVDHDGVGAWPAVRNVQHFTETNGVAYQIGNPERIDLREKFTRPNSQRIDGPGPDIEIVFAPHLNQARCRQIRIRTAERPEYLYGKRHLSRSADFR